jgi:small subunit ribosomal protein S18
MSAARPRRRSAKDAAPRRRRLTEEERARLRYNDPEFLGLFLSSRGRIRPRRQTGLSRRDQDRLARAVKLARELALLPYVADAPPAKAGERRRGGRGAGMPPI